MSDRELIQRIYERWGRGDYSSAEGVHPEFELTFAPGFLDEGHFSGIDDAWRGWKDWLDQWESWQYEPVRYIELEDGRMAVFIDMHGVSRTTGVELPGEGANLWEFEDGLARRLRLYAHRADMVRELGLDEA